MERLTLTDSQELKPWVNHKEALERLAAYEDSGLEPEEVRELAQAKKDGRLVMLPCKVGDTVYRIAKKKKYLNNPKNTMYLKEIVIKPENMHKYITEIGKTVFLTREEAEALCRELGVDYYIKDSLRKEMEAKKGGEGK